jgi:hypothetical protein
VGDSSYELIWVLVWVSSYLLVGKNNVTKLGNTLFIEVEKYLIVEWLVHYYVKLGGMGNLLSSL